MGGGGRGENIEEVGRQEREQGKEEKGRKE